MPRFPLARMPMYRIVDTSEELENDFEHDKEMESYGAGSVEFT
jgi:hypothetical protein